MVCNQDWDLTFFPNLRFCQLQSIHKFWHFTNLFLHRKYDNTDSDSESGMGFWSNKARTIQPVHSIQLKSSNPPSSIYSTSFNQSMIHLFTEFNKFINGLRVFQQLHIYYEIHTEKMSFCWHSYKYSGEIQVFAVGPFFTWKRRIFLLILWSREVSFFLQVVWQR